MSFIASNLPEYRCLPRRDKLLYASVRTLFLSEKTVPVRTLELLWKILARSLLVLNAQPFQYILKYDFFVFFGVNHDQVPLDTPFLEELHFGTEVFDTLFR